MATAAGTHVSRLPWKPRPSQHNTHQSAWILRRALPPRPTSDDSLCVRRQVCRTCRGKCRARCVVGCRQMLTGRQSAGVLCERIVVLRQLALDHRQEF